MCQLNVIEVNCTVERGKEEKEEERENVCVLCYPSRFATANMKHGFNRIFCQIRRFAVYHFNGTNAQCPTIDHFRVTMSERARVR